MMKNRLKLGTSTLIILLFGVFNLNAQAGAINGIVSSGGTPLQGVSISIKGTELEIV